VRLKTEELRMKKCLIPLKGEKMLELVDMTIELAHHNYYKEEVTP
jgi:hypothetical protein